jgi:hypothetical protein
MESPWRIDEIIPPEEVLLPDSVVAYQVVHKTLRCLVNWDQSPKMQKLGWPQPIILNGKKHRQLGPLRAFLKNSAACLPEEPD